MKRILFAILLNMLSIAVVSYFIPGLRYEGGLVTLGIISVILAVGNIFVKPIIKIFTLPIELVTLGLFGIIINAGMLYLISYLYPQFSLHGFYFAGFDNPYFAINSMQIPQWGTAVIASFLIGVITSLISWLTD